MKSTMMESGLPAVSSETISPNRLVTTVAFEPRRSSWVSWTVRLAQAADRVVARTFSADNLAGEGVEGLVARTLNGLDRCCRLIPTHQGVVTTERARLTIRHIARMRKDRYRRFLKVRQAMTRFRTAVDPSGCYIHLNPVSRWIPTSDASVGCQSKSWSGSVLFFLAESEIRGVRMNLEGQVLINELADYQPCTILQWARLSSLADGPELAEFVQQLGDIGLVAWSDQ